MNKSNAEQVERLARRFSNTKCNKKQALHGILGEEQLGGASADAQSYWQGRFAACTFVGGFLGIGRTRNSWGVAPTPTRDAVP